MQDDQKTGSCFELTLEEIVGSEVVCRAEFRNKGRKLNGVWRSNQKRLQVGKECGEEIFHDNHNTRRNCVITSEEVIDGVEV